VVSFREEELGEEAQVIEVRFPSILGVHTMIHAQAAMHQVDRSSLSLLEPEHHTCNAIAGMCACPSSSTIPMPPMAVRWASPYKEVNGNPAA
jgi:hypothetical protein